MFRNKNKSLLKPKRNKTNTTTTTTPNTTTNATRTKSSTIITDPKEYMEQLEQKIKVYYPNKIDALLRFRETILNDEENKSYFDQEDLSWIDTELERYSKELDVLEKEFQHKDHIYQNGLLNFEKMLSNRERILNQLNDETNLFEEVPSLREAFVKKHVDLVKNLEILKETLCKQIIE
jgi:hypothetical protein